MENEELTIRKSRFRLLGLLLSYPVAYLYWRMMLLDLGHNLTFVGPTIFTLIFIAWNEITLRGYKEKAKEGTIFWYAAMVIVALLSTFSPSFELSMFAIHLCAVYSVLYSNNNLLEGKTGGFIAFDLLRAIFAKGLVGLPSIFVDAFKVPSEHKALKKTSEENPDESLKAEKKKATLYGIIVVAVAAVFMIIVVALLSSINAQFGNMVEKILSVFEWNFDISEYIAGVLIRIILAFPTSIVLYAGVSKCASSDGTEDKKAGDSLIASNARKHVVPATLINIVVGLFILLYIVFFIFEGSYIFGALFGRIPEGFNVVSYARNGFFELTWVMAINMLLYLLVNLFTKDASKSKVNKILLITLMVCCIIFAIVSFVKLAMYFGTFGYTPKRLLAMWGTVVLAAASIFVIVSVIKEKNFAREWILVTVVSYVVMCIIGACFVLPVRLNIASRSNSNVYVVIRNRADEDVYEISMSTNQSEEFFYDLGHVSNADGSPVLKDGDEFIFSIDRNDLPDDFEDSRYLLEILFVTEDGECYPYSFTYSEEIGNGDSVVYVTEFNEIYNGDEYVNHSFGYVNHR